MSVEGKRRFPSIVEAAISSKSGIKKVTAETFRSDAAAILEAAMGEFDEQVLLDAMTHQGFEAAAYRSTLGSLIRIAKKRRPQRLAGSTTKRHSSTHST